MKRLEEQLIKLIETQQQITIDPEIIYTTPIPGKIGLGSDKTVRDETSDHFRFLFDCCD